MATTQVTWEHKQQDTTQTLKPGDFFVSEDWGLCLFLGDSICRDCKTKNWAVVVGATSKWSPVGTEMHQFPPKGNVIKKVVITTE